MTPQERDQHLQTLADLAGRTAASPFVGDDQSHRSRRWPWPALEQMHERKYLFRNVGLELFFADGRSFLLVFPSVERRNAARSILAFKAPSAAAFGSLNVGASSFSSKLSDAVLGPRTKLEQMTRRWERREVSNFECAPIFVR